jgi:hypothetical protein
VEESALPTLATLKPGDTVVLTGGTANDQVIAIAKLPDASK